MRQLHVVSLSEDGRSVLLATSKAAKTGAFSLPLDGKLASAVRGDLPRQGEQQVRDVGVTPKEIQARLRAGESSEQIANAAGVPVARVERFAGPVLSERERVIDEARAAYLSRSRRGVSQLPLGDAVDASLAETSGLRQESVTWTARRLDSGHWLVQVSYVARARTRTSSWVYEPHTRSITASDSASATLGHVGDEALPRGAGSSARVAPGPRTAARPAAKRPAKKAAKKSTKATPKKAVKKAAPKPAAKPVAKQATPKTTAKPVAKKAAKKAPAKKKAPARKATKPTATARKTAPKPAASKAGRARRSGSRVLRTSAAAEAAAATPVVQWGPPVAPATPPTLRVVPQETVEPASDPAPAEPETPAAPKRRAAGQRAHVPDWADVLLGTAPKRSDD